MILFFSIVGISWVAILIGVLGFVFGYIIRGGTGSTGETKLADAEQHERRVKQLESDLEKCRQEKASQQKKLDELVSYSQGDGSHPEEDVDVRDEVSDEVVIVAPDLDRDDSGEQASPIDPPQRKSKFEALENDNLQIVEGIGPKMESVLKENGVNNWSQLGDQSQDSLRIILEKYGNKYKIIDPDSWPKQARLAAKTDWSQLIRLQKGLDAGRGFAIGNTPAKIEKVMIKLGIIKEYKQDDLKAIEGIGPKIAELLHAGGINSWKQLAQTQVTALQKILDKAGKRYQLADPGTWPKQAELADAGKFDELSDYQDFLQGGK